MTIKLSPPNRKRLREALLAHREKNPLIDSQYANEVHHISLNTYKKCVEPDKAESLALQRNTFINIFRNTGLDPADYGLPIGIRDETSIFGGYRKAEYSHLCGRFFLYRRSFLTARNLTRAVLQIAQSKTEECLTFSEQHDYVSETNTRESFCYEGNVHMNRERTLLSLPSFIDGDVRLTHLIPERGKNGPSKLRMRGAVLTFGNPKGHWQPTVSCVLVEGPFDEKKFRKDDLCKTIRPDSADYASISAELEVTEKFSTIMTPLMWAIQHATAQNV